MDYQDRSLKAQFKAANNMGAEYVCVIGEDELKSGKVTLKNMNSGDQQTLTLEEGLDILKRAELSRKSR
jgi:histidyl-tRNA synthetase